MKTMVLQVGILWERGTPEKIIITGELLLPHNTALLLWPELSTPSTEKESETQERT